MDSIVGMWDLAYIRKDSGNRPRNKTQSAPWDSEGLTSNGTRHLATLISVICEFGIGRCLFKEPRSGSQCSFPFNRAIFVSDHPFDWTSADTKGILHPRDWDKMEKSVGTAGLRNPIRNLPPPTYSFFIYCNHRQKCWEGCYFFTSSSFPSSAASGPMLSKTLMFVLVIVLLYPSIEKG